MAPFVELLKDDYYIDAKMIADAIRRKSCFNVIHLATSFKVDIFAVKDRDYDRAAMQRIRQDSLDREHLSERVFPGRAGRRCPEQAGMVPAWRRGFRETTE